VPSDVTDNRGRYGNDNAVREDDLQAYVDGQLDARRRATIEAHLAAHPGEAVRVTAYRNQNIGLHALFDPLDGPDDAATVADLPPALAALAGEIDAALRTGRAAAASAPAAKAVPATGERRRHLPRLAASIALLLAAGIAGWIALQQGNLSDVPRVALTHENQAAPQAAIQAQPAAVPAEPAAAPLPEATAPAAAEKSAPVASQPAGDPANVDPAIERTPLIPVPQPATDTTSKDT